MSQARKLIKGMQKMGDKINNIIEDAKNEPPKPPVILFAIDIDKTKLAQIKEQNEEDEVKIEIDDPPIDVTINGGSCPPSQIDRKNSDSLIYSSPSRNTGTD